MQAISAFAATRLARASETVFASADSLVTSLDDRVPNNTRPAYDRFKADVEAAADVIKPIIKAIEDQTKLIAEMATESVADAKIEPFTAELALVRLVGPQGDGYRVTGDRTVAHGEQCGQPGDAQRSRSARLHDFWHLPGSPERRSAATASGRAPPRWRPVPR